MKCKYCGFELDNAAKFCPNCGANTAEDVVSNMPNNNVNTTAVGAMAPSTSGAGMIAPRHVVHRPVGFGVTAWIIMGIVLLLMGFAFTTVMMIDSNSSGENLAFLLLGGYLIILLISLPGLFFLGFLMFLSFIFSIIQLAKTRRAFSWVTFIGCILIIALTVVFVMFIGSSNIAGTMFN